MAASGQVLASAGGRGCRVITEVIAAVLSAAAAPSEASSWAGRGDSRDDDDVGVGVVLRSGAWSATLPAPVGEKNCRVDDEVIAAVLSAAAVPGEALSWAGRGDSRGDDDVGVGVLRSGAWSTTFLVAYSVPRTRLGTTAAWSSVAAGCWLR